jgi:hypothetical protein
MPPTVAAPTLIKPVHPTSTSTNMCSPVSTQIPPLTGCSVGVALLQKFYVQVEVHRVDSASSTIYSASNWSMSSIPRFVRPVG